MRRPRYADADALPHFLSFLPLAWLTTLADRVPQEAQIKPLRGFDRLASAGFSEEDILNIRRQFHSRSVADYLSAAEFPTEEECASVRSLLCFQLH